MRRLDHLRFQHVDVADEVGDKTVFEQRFMMWVHPFQVQYEKCRNSPNGCLPCLAGEMERC